MTIDAVPPEPAAGGSGRQFGELPAVVRQRIVEWAADALGSVTAAEVPTALARFARFAPAKRARLAGPALGQALQSDPAFRALVAERAARRFDHRAESADAAVDPAARPIDPVDAAAGGFLLNSPDLAQLLDAAAEIAEQAGDRARVADLERQIAVLNAKLARVTAESPKGAGAANKRPESTADADRLRLRLRAQGTQLRELREQVAAASGRTADLLAAVTAERDAARADAELWRLKAESAEARAESAAAGVQRMREAKSDRRATSDRRLELLLSAVEGAAAGLRREWDLVGGGPAPADVVAAGLPRPAPEAERTTDPARLTAWAGMPGAHLIVDGYNVTKTGFGELSLSDQRDRLVRSLGALAARTSAEVTVVFDGAAVAAARPPARGIRVLFSPPGVSADAVIGDLVRAEPVGRSVIVVSSDREVADRAAADGARTAASTVLLAAMGS